MNTKFLTPLLISFFALNASAQEAKTTTAGFAKLDTNKDGFLSRAEAAKEKGLSAVFKEADQNKTNT